MYELPVTVCPSEEPMIENTVSEVAACDPAPPGGGGVGGGGVGVFAVRVPVQVTAPGCCGEANS